MTENKIQETVKIVAGEEHNEPATAAPAQNVVLDASTPSVRSILRVVLVTLVVLSVADFFKSIITSLTYLFFLIVLSIFFAYLIEPLVQMIRRPFEVANRDNYMPRPLAIASAYLVVFSTIGVAVAVLTPMVSEQFRH
jgi:predicted PurR-regulated permease PerM